jgi:hypothetical protein
MTVSSAFERFAVAYGTVFPLLYVVARARGLALFTVYPSVGVILPGMHRSRDFADPALEFLAPEMWWYGWIASAAIGAVGCGMIAILLPERSWRWFWPGWVWISAISAMIASVYLTIPWFRQ